jgi:RNA polymerase sigma-70 factor
MVHDEQQYERFLQLFAANRDRLFAYVYSLLPHHADAEDVFQRCSVLMWRKFDQFEPDGSFMAWGCGVAFYEVKNFLRSANRNRLQFDADLVSQLAVQRMEKTPELSRKAEALSECVHGLKSSDRELIHHAYHDDQGLKVYAEASGKAVQTLYNRLSILRRQLMDCVQRKLNLEGFY